MLTAARDFFTVSPSQRRDATLGAHIMMIVLFDMDGGHIAQAPITTDKHGYLHVNHPNL
jgi:hypothetical protein